MEERDLFSWNVLIGGYGKRGYFDEALEMYGKMLWVGGVGFKPDVYTFPSVLRTCGGLGDWKRGLLDMGVKLHELAKRTGYEDNGFPDKAVETYKMMELEGVMPDEITMASVLSACASLGLLDMGVKLHELAKRTDKYRVGWTLLLSLKFSCSYCISGSAISLNTKVQSSTSALLVFCNIKVLTIASMEFWLASSKSINDSFKFRNA
ncbi:unnamed protein product [Fraxinus pennsylvanica]|uniref:Pentatricopeptide repeat-containing protein n=1 Tax=Fraxinus pennsylvanica TaxID=56036 RepID=A0AAD2AE72_9LAMI|nr:unnamed protein product [Fraxinus pennsylvanica]